MKEIHGDNEENDGVCRALCVVEDEIKFRESTKREREGKRCKSNFAWRSLGVYAATTRMIHRAWKSPRPSSGTAAGSGGGGGSLHSSSTSPPPASRRSSIRGAPPLPRTFQWRHWSLGTPSPSRQDSTTPLWNLVLLRRVYSNRDAPCAFPMNSQRLMEGGFLGGRDDSIILFVIHICVFRLDSSTSIINSSEIYWYKGEYTISRRL